MAASRLAEPSAPAGPNRALFLAGLLTLVWLFPGLIGHDPWKPDEAYSIGLIQHVLSTGDWVVPAILGEPFLQNPPLYPLTAALFTKLFGWALPMHDAARLASGFYLLIAAGALSAAARELYGRGQSWLAPLAFVGALGLAPPAHTLIGDVGELAGFAVAIYGFALSLRRPVAGGVCIGIGTSVGFLCKGLLAPIAVVATAMLLPILDRRWRNRAYLGTCTIALAAAAPWAALWCGFLYQRSPMLFWQWWSGTSAFQRIAAAPARIPLALGYYLTVLPWFAFPALPLAAWAVWEARRTWRERPDVVLAVSLLAATLLALSFGAIRREALALPLLAPLAILAARGALQLRRGAASYFWWFSAFFGSFVLLMAWFEYSALELGFPGARHRHWLRLQPGYQAGFEWWTVALAAALTLLWIALLRYARSLPARGMVAWCGGVCVVWAVALVMFLDYVDTGKTYRGVAAQIAQHVQKNRCVASRGLGQSQRILLHYFTGIATVRADTPNASVSCPTLVVQGLRWNIAQPGSDWSLAWEGARPGDRKELLRVYRKR